VIKEAATDVKDGTLYFDWFIAANHRMHLDSNGLNPQTEKQMARWFVTSTSSRTDVNRTDIDHAIAGKSNAVEEAVSFAYAVVQAFEGAELDGVKIVSIDRAENGQVAVLADAKKLLSLDIGVLKELSLTTAHIGHSCLGIANIMKYQKAKGVFESDIVYETDGLTNGFAFRSLQFPVFSKDVTTEEWLEKGGILLPSSDYYETAESMNSVIGGDLLDVYTTVGRFFGKAMEVARPSIEGNDLLWIKLFEGYAENGGIPNFSADTDESKKFIRTLTKSPVTTFGYAASAGNIAIKLVHDQVYGRGHLDGKGIVDLLTAKEKGEYVVKEGALQDQFGRSLGTRYHNARVALDKVSLEDNKNPDIKALRAALTDAVTALYAAPLVDTLTGLF
jgi:hypothetical protein